MQKFNHDFFRGVWRLTRTYWSSEEKWQARGLLAVIVGLNLGYIYLQVLFNEWFNTFYTALQNYDMDGSWRALGLFGMLATINIIVVVYMTYLQQMLELKWRSWLTENYLGDWLRNRTYYQMRLLDDSTDNPDQRISEDLSLFTSMTLSLSLGLLRAVVTLVSFVVILWKLSGVLPVSLGTYQFVIPGYMVWVVIFYAAIGTWLTFKIGNPLVRLNFGQQRFEADFRFSMIRLRENSEGIAFYGGESKECSGFVERFRHVFENFWQIMRRRKQLTWFTASYSQIAHITALLFSLPRYFSHQITLGGLLQTTTAFDHVRESLSFFVASYVTIAEWQAVVTRLTGFTNNMAKVREQAGGNHGAQIVTEDRKTFKVTDLDVKLPNNKILVDHLNLELGTGDTLLIVGPSGSGKSTLMRAMAGIWPFGQGRILVPEGQSTLFLPQKPYLPLGTLRDVLLYPSAGRAVSDEGIKETMRLCKLEWLQEHLDKVEEWSHVLSLGEQQRIAFARALLQQPKWLFLDEATSALDEPAEQLMYQLLKEKLPGTALISVGHRSTLKDFHKKKLTIDGSGKWSILH